MIYPTVKGRIYIFNEFSFINIFVFDSKMYCYLGRHVNFYLYFCSLNKPIKTEIRNAVVHGLLVSNKMIEHGHTLTTLPGAYNYHPNDDMDKIKFQ